MPPENLSNIRRLPRSKACGALALCAALLAAGCANLPDARKDADYQARGYSADRPVVRPTRSISSFSESLVCMDHMLLGSEIATTLISSKNIPDVSGRVAVATKDMIVTALSQMSRLSSAFRFVDYEVDIARQDTVQNLTTIMLNTNQVQLQRPALYFSGAIAFVDQNIIDNHLDAAVSGTRVEAAYSKTRSASIIGLELHLGDFRSRTLIPGMDSANEVVLGSGGRGLDLAGRIGTYGVKFNVGGDYTLGTGAAVRTLVELATIELVGKWARIPYWQCLTLEQTHPEFQRQLLDWFNQDGAAAQRQLIRRSLVRRGYLAEPDSHLADDSPTLREALARFQADNGVTVTGVVDFNTYERALRDFVSLGGDGKLARIGWDGKSAPPEPRTLDLRIENLRANRGEFEVGEQIFVSARSSRASFLSCYYWDSGGQIIRLLPNNSNRSMWMAANQSVRIPDWMSPNPGFIMDAPGTGEAGLACFATDLEAGARLPDALRGPSFQPIAGYGSLDQLTGAYADAFGTQGYAMKTLRWNVSPRRGAAAQ